MANLVTTEANNILNASSGQAAFSAPSGGTGSQKVALCTTTGSAGAAGTEVTGGTYARQNITFSAAASGQITNNANLNFTGMPACTVNGVDEYDANNTTRRWFGSLSSPKTVNSGDTFSILASNYTKTLG